MSNKTFIIVITIIVLITFFPIFIVSIWDVSDREEAEVPTLELKLSTEEPEQEAVTITAIGRIKDAKGILSISLPDGSVKYSDLASFSVTENGEYSFEVEARNGQKFSQRIEVNNIRVYSADNPYIPDGFEYVEGTARTGYVIKDSFENEYVWIPVDSGSFEKIASEKEQLKYEEDDDSVVAFMKSVEKYYGFYIARYESSVYKLIANKTIAATICQKEPWTNITYETAHKLATNSGIDFSYEDVQTSLINGYAWDSALSFLNSTVENYSSSVIYGNYGGQVIETGRTETDKINNICDMAGNVKEWTTEKFNDEKSTKINRVVRGGNATLNKTASSRTNCPVLTSEDALGFRMILYKVEI